MINRLEYNYILYKIINMYYSKTLIYIVYSIYTTGITFIHPLNIHN